MKGRTKATPEDLVQEITEDLREMNGKTVKPSKGGTTKSVQEEPSEFDDEARAQKGKMKMDDLPMCTKELELSNWRVTSNVTNNEATRIIVGWDPKVYDVVNLHVSSQWITCRVHSISYGFGVIISFFMGKCAFRETGDVGVYYGARGCNKSQPWVLMGDFNATIQSSDSKGGDSTWSRQKQEFGQCLHQAELHLVPYRGIKYTYHNGQNNENMILKRLNWIIGNTTFAKKWLKALAHFLLRSISDHNSMMLNLRQGHFHSKPNFKFLNF
ncbi:hypothetical protein OIU84_012653 [Salix udensis]|uniref:Reverse transcriptase n=1 Tax=Salix udensis TaxID=889485 RepID=A0AAD6NTL6_9ROSI|nr:hypothetical protein OIU84_012653 [Salix udensis]